MEKTGNMRHKCLFYFALAGFLLFGLTPATAETPAELSQNERVLAGQINNVFRRAIAQVRPAVVSLQVSKEIPEGPFHYGGQSLGLGSGCIIDKQGYVITNDHVVKGTDKVDVILADGSRFKALDWWTDPDTDLAVVRIDAAGQDLPVAKFGDSDLARVGDFVLAMGSPFNLEQTVTSGIISFKGRATHILDREWGYEDFIQTDADINKGNSGGPLVNLYGEIIGINSNIFSPSPAGISAGYGFAVPSNIARFVADELIKQKRVRRGWLGVGMTSLDDLRKAHRHGLEKGYGQDLKKLLAKYPEALAGVLILEVKPDSPAERAGVKEHDIILEINNKKTEDSRKLRNFIATLAPDSMAKALVWRKGKELKLSIRLGDRQVAKSQEQGQKTKEYTKRWPFEIPRRKPRLEDQPPRLPKTAKLGVFVEPLSSQTAGEFGYDENTEGLIIKYVQPGSLAQESGLEVGDIIISIDDQKIGTVEQLRNIISRADLDDKGVVMHIKNRSGDYMRIIKRGAD